MGAVPGCSEPAPFPRVDAAFDARLPDVPLPDVPYVRPDAPTLPPADIEVTLPFDGPPAAIDIEVEAGLAFLDVVFSVDATGSFGGEIDALQRSLDATVLPQLEERVGEVAVGIARFEDFPVEPWGADTDRPFELVTAITTDRSRIGGALATLGTLGSGGDLPESGAEALYQIATGEGFVLDGRAIVAPFSRAASGGGELGGAGFREGSFRVVVHVTDAPTHEPREYGATVPGAHSSDDAIAAMQALDLHGLGIASNDVARAHLERIALATGATMAPTAGRCPTGRDGGTRGSVGGLCPLVFDVGDDGEGLSGAIVDAIAGLLDTLTWRDAHGEVVDDRYGFVRHIEAVEGVPPAGGTTPAREDRIGADGVLDTFVDVSTGTTLRFRAELWNRRIPGADYDQFFHVAIRITGDGVVLEERTIRVLVPAEHRDGGGASDAGLDAGDLDGGELDGGEPDVGLDAPS